ncbi:hypothetical protein HHI36_009588 [Cryptolaemus montrouzieri]|uniref:Pre-SET domain-containing protein n=1 Tax=Cryptolaemus montrouzieri TaxID=559131 RepID=A0ABD2MG73_9CUCU
MKECNLKDSYEHPDTNIEYLPESELCVELEKLYEHEFCGCSCLINCLPESCSCLQRSGAQYIFINQQVPETYIIKETNTAKPIYECNDNCRCAKDYVEIDWYNVVLKKD